MEPARSAIAWPRERMVWMASSARPPNASATMGMHSTPASRQAGRLEASLRCTPTWRAWPGVTEASGRVCCWRELITWMSRAAGRPLLQQGRNTSAGREREPGAKPRVSLEGARARVASQIYALNNYAFLAVNGMPILHLW